jgi:hypothetical protein
VTDGISRRRSDNQAATSAAGGTPLTKLYPMVNAFDPAALAQWDAPVHTAALRWGR